MKRFHTVAPERPRVPPAPGHPISFLTFGHVVIAVAHAPKLGRFDRALSTRTLLVDGRRGAGVAACGLLPLLSVRLG